jgi:DNA-binding XRE family transcriptional regulator
MDIKEYGKVLRAFREELGYTQEKFGQVLDGASPRTVNYIEMGSRRLKKSELRALMEHFPNFDLQRLDESLPTDLEIVDRSGNSTETGDDPLFKKDTDFAIWQRGLLTEFPRTYEIWMLNMENIAMLDSDELENVWIENIVAGTYYTVVWDLSQDDPSAVSAFAIFQRSCGRILKEVSRLAPLPLETNAIVVYGVFSLLRQVSGEERNRRADLSSKKTILEEYLSLLTIGNLPAGLKIHFPFAEEVFVRHAPSHHWRLFRETMGYKSAMLLYLSKKDNFSGAEHIAILEPRGTKNGFESKAEPIKDAFLSLINDIASRYIEAIQCFENWYHSESESGFNPTKVILEYTELLKSPNSTSKALFDVCSKPLPFQLKKK